ncbi:ATP-dependent DNA helicase PcrA [Striga asiatica]|uniref:ATP-dependent DNA helicase PcrA n=1 Tax=Striga asiatica TaxID=4170 RepID=A0A5A7PB37_STRAF|nr:ATP-dependent DNA helicase PcrA [Striga asiatica]
MIPVQKDFEFNRRQTLITSLENQLNAFLPSLKTFAHTKKMNALTFLSYVVRLTARVFLYAIVVRYLKLHARAFVLTAVGQDLTCSASASIKLVDVASKQSIEADWAVKKPTNPHYFPPVKIDWGRRRGI